MAEHINLHRRSLFKGQLKPQQLPRLPWAIAEADFLKGCTQCGKCIDICDTQIIKRDTLGYPFVDFDQYECTFCNKCIDVCPADIFKADKQGKPWSGDFVINNHCLAKNHIYCQSCKDICESKAITFQHDKSAIAEPKLNNQDCSQCGACISICPQNAIAFQLQTKTRSTTVNPLDINNE